MCASLRQFAKARVDFRAGQRAIYLFACYLITGRLIAWDKTAHLYPTEDALRNYRRQLGDLLLDKGHITVAQLEHGLREQKSTGEPLGCVLLRLGHIREVDLITLLARQLQVPCEVKSIEADGPLPSEMLVEVARQYGVVPGRANGDELLLHMTCGFTETERQTLEKLLQRSIRICLTTAELIRKAVQDTKWSIAATENLHHIGAER